MRQTSEPNTQLTVVAGVIFAVLLVVCVFFLQALFYDAESRENVRKVVAVVPEELAQARAQQVEQISAYRRIDQKKGIVAIPIDRAMELVLKEGVAAKPVPGQVPPASAVKQGPPGR